MILRSATGCRMLALHIASLVLPKTRKGNNKVVEHVLNIRAKYGACS